MIRLHLRWNPADWNIVIRHVIIANGSFSDDKILDKNVSTVFDSYHMHFSNIQGDFKDVSFVKDSIRAKMNLSTKENSGFIVQQLNANIKFYPEGMEFYHFRPDTRVKVISGIFLRCVLKALMTYQISLQK